MDEFEKEWCNWTDREQLVRECGNDADLAKLVYRVVGKGALAYLDERPQVLEGRSPRQCLASRKGRSLLRKALMKFPYI